METQFGKKVKALHSENGGEYIVKDFIDFCIARGIRREFTAPYTHAQNGVAKRKSTHIAQIARAFMKKKGMPHVYWAEVISTTVYIMNRTPIVVIHDVTPEERFTEVLNQIYYILKFLVDV